MSNTAKTPEAVADFLDTLASDQIACQRWQTLKRDKLVCRIRAEVYADAASLVRHYLVDTAP